MASEDFVRPMQKRTYRHVYSRMLSPPQTTGFMSFARIFRKTPKE